MFHYYALGIINHNTSTSTQYMQCKYVYVYVRKKMVERELSQAAAADVGERVRSLLK